MTTNYSPLSLLSASRADRASVLMHYMVEDYAGLDWDLGLRPPARGQRPDTGADRTSGPELDDATQRKLQVFASLLGLSRAEAERCYAEYWLVYTVLAAYARPMHANGWGFVQMVAQLDSLTQRAQTLLPRMRVPGFECLQLAKDSVVVRLREEHPMAAPFLRGLLRRLAADFGVELNLGECPEHGSSAVGVEVVTPAVEGEPEWEAAPLIRRMKPAFSLPTPQRENRLQFLAV